MLSRRLNDLDLRFPLELQWRANNQLTKSEMLGDIQFGVRFGMSVYEGPGENVDSLMSRESCVDREAFEKGAFTNCRSYHRMYI